MSDLTIDSHLFNDLLRKININFSSAVIIYNDHEERIEITFDNSDLIFVIHAITPVDLESEVEENGLIMTSTERDQAATIYAFKHTSKWRLKNLNHISERLEIKQVSEKYFRVVAFSENKEVEYQEVEGIKIPNEKGLDMYEYDFAIYDGITGFAMVLACDEPLEALEKLFKIKTVRSITKAISKRIDVYGLSPRYKKKEG